jgi:hypothetical protein
MTEPGGPNPSNEHQERPPRRHWQAAVRPHWVEIVLAVALIVVGGAQVCIYLRQASIMDKQATIAEEQTRLAKINERAFIFKNEIDLISTLDEKGNVIEWRVAPQWKNGGATRTKSLKMVMGCPEGDFNLSTGKPIDCPNKNIRKETGFYSRFLGPQQTSHNEGSCEAWTPAQVAAIPHHRFFMWAYAQYTDIFDDEHKTRFCQGVILSGDPYKAGGLAAESIIVRGGNCTDEVCDEEDRKADN